MTTKPVTFINVIEVVPDRQSELLNLLQEGAEQVIRHQPGFLALDLYASLDGNTVINIALWESPEAVAATQAVPAAAEYAARTAAIATAHPALFTLTAEIR